MKRTTPRRAFVGITLYLLALSGLLSYCRPPQIEQPTTIPLPPEGCKIVRTIYKTQGAYKLNLKIADPEQVTLDDGRQVRVSLEYITTYHYDQQGRITEETDKGPSGSSRVISFIYGDRQLTMLIKSYDSQKTLVRQDTTFLPLNSDGLLTYYTPVGQSQYVYNAEGQMVSSSPDRPAILNRYLNGNLTEQTRFATWVQQNGQWIPTDYQLIRYEHDLARPNLPEPRQFLGATSHNLPTKEVREMRLSSSFADGPVYQRTFQYSYDKRGLVKRRIANGKALNPQWLMEEDSYGVGVIDYEYACP
ncbi:hypothetical protein F5984_01820 [Rudanella paleaurantiibacter]|uniref:DUF4595 domain-containing protein n=1 Tax=Rudanella paleaurantiibacter TaxID=2614655 RepID=A0A7J5U4E4_9BACT|nr:MULTISPECIES: hypothetical protein [Rudanella]KAB7732714.1 hypothetical protein F5984_01820 [Rudanella paleaurantiibacter]